MPAPLVWTEARDTMLRDLRGAGKSWDIIGAALGISRWAANQRGHLLGAQKPPAPARDPNSAPLSGREPLAAGHPVTWGAITAATLLAGTAYPFPPLADDAGWELAA